MFSKYNRPSLLAVLTFTFFFIFTLNIGSAQQLKKMKQRQTKPKEITITAGKSTKVLIPGKHPKATFRLIPVSKRIGKKTAPITRINVSPGDTDPKKRGHYFTFKVPKNTQEGLYKLQYYNNQKKRWYSVPSSTPLIKIVSKKAPLTAASRTLEMQQRQRAPISTNIAAMGPVIESVSPTRFTIGATIVITGQNLNEAEADVSINKFNQTGYWVKISNNSAVSDGASGLYTPGSFVKIHSWNVNEDGTRITFGVTGISAYNPYRTLWSRSTSNAQSSAGGDRQPCDPEHTYVPSWTTPETVRGKLRLRARSLGNTIQNFWALASPMEVEIYDVEACHPGETRCMNDLPCGWNMCRTYRCD